MFFLLSVGTRCWTSSRVAGDLRRHGPHVMHKLPSTNIIHFFKYSLICSLICFMNCNISQYFREWVNIYRGYSYDRDIRNHSGYGISQWETTLICLLWPEAIQRMIPACLCHCVFDHMIMKMYDPSLYIYEYIHIYIFSNVTWSIRSDQYFNPNHTIIHYDLCVTIHVQGRSSQVVIDITLINPIKVSHFICAKCKSKQCMIQLLI